MSEFAGTPNHDRVRRIVRLMLAHVVDNSITARDVKNVFDMAGADPDYRDAVLRGLSQAGIRVIEEAPVSARGSDGGAPSETASTKLAARPADRASPAEDTAAARRVLHLDRLIGKPSKRVLTAQEEVGLALLMRGPGVPLERELPEGYRSGLEPEDERAHAFDAFMLHNVRLVWSVARTQDTGGLELEDLVQHGMLGLRRAVEKFDATQGNKFSTYATWWIRQSISRGIANEGRLIRVPVHMNEYVKKVMAVRNRLLAEYGVSRMPSLMRETGLSAEKVAECLRLGTGTVSLDRPIEEGGDSLGDFVLQQPDNEADPAQLIERMLLGKLIRSALTDLPEREARILALRAGLDSDEPQTLDEIGKVFGVTRERIRQIEEVAIAKLRTALTARGLAPLRPPATPSSDDDSRRRKRSRRDARGGRR